MNRIRTTLHRLLVRRSRRRRERGLTMLEIMIVIAILGLVMGLVVVPRVMDMFSKSKEDIAKLAIDKFAFEAYPQWSLANSQTPCPADLMAVAAHMGKTEKDTIDPWGTQYKMFCGQNVPAGAKGFAVMSAGPDKQEGTADDIKSW
ncbi:MAG: prepilin-type N-terminal cleavage/methylation domain-containing protein [Kofleriaceae bacterium]